MYPEEPDERSAKKRFIMASPADVGEVAAVCPDLSIPPRKPAKTLTMLPCRRLHVSGLAYYCISGKLATNIKLIHSDGFTWAMSQVMWSIPNPSGSTAVDLFDGPPADLLCQAVKDL